MDNFSTMMLAQNARRNKNNRKIIEWSKVFKTIIDNNIKNAEVGLSEDFNETKALILVNETLLYPPKDTSQYCTYLDSVWATPVLYDIDNGLTYDCYKEVPYDSDEKFTIYYLKNEKIKEIIEKSKLKII